jgi:hypothetical protein
MSNPAFCFYTEHFLYFTWLIEVAAVLFCRVTFFLTGTMKPIEVTSYVPAILFGSFRHAVVHHVPQDYKYIQGAVDSSEGLAPAEDI